MAMASTQAPVTFACMTNPLMMVKQERLDPSYDNSSPISMEPKIEKVKRKYVRKPKVDGVDPDTQHKRIKKELVELSENGVPMHQQKITDLLPVQKRKRDRFKGMTEAEVLTKVLPDHIKEDLDILIVGINPGLTAAYVQHHYAGPGNHFWKCLFLAGLTPEPMNALQDNKLLEYGIGFTNIVERTTRGSADLTRKEIAEGGVILKEKVLKYRPKIALFNGKGIYEVFCGHKNFNFGLQPDPFPDCPDTVVFVNPSSSARCTQLPRAVDKVPFYEALKRVRDHIRTYGSINDINRDEVTFPDFKLVTAPTKKVKDEIKDEPNEDFQMENDSPFVNEPEEPPENPNPKPNPKPARRRVSKKAQKEQATQNCNQLSSAQSSFPNSQGTMPADMGIKRELSDNHNDHDLTAVLHQNFYHSPHAAFQPHYAHGMMANGVLANGMLGNYQTKVKQERPDVGQYGIMPVCTSASSVLPSYPAYTGYWNYLQCAAAGNFMPAQYNGIPPSHMAANGAAGSTVQRASSPAMSSQSTLTQASLDSLPKADSALTVANWLQGIPNITQ